MDEPFARPFRLAGETLHDMPALTRALARNWDAGRALLLDGTLARFFRLTRPDMEEICLHAERDAARRVRGMRTSYLEGAVPAQPAPGRVLLARGGVHEHSCVWAGDAQALVGGR